MKIVLIILLLMSFNVKAQDNELLFSTDTQRNIGINSRSYDYNTMKIMNIDYERTINKNIFFHIGISNGKGSDEYYTIKHNGIQLQETNSTYESIRFGMGFRY